MSARLRQNLEIRRKQLGRQVAARLVNEPNADVGQEIAQVQTIDAVLTTLPVPRSQSIAAPVVIALICLLAVWIAWTVTIDTLGWRTGIGLEVEAAAVDFLAGRVPAQPATRLSRGG